MSESSTIEQQLTRYFSTHPQLGNINEDKLTSQMFTRLVQGRIRMLMGSRGEWGGGGEYTDITQIPKLRLERMMEEIMENLR